MVSFNGLNFNNIGFNMPFGVRHGKTITDVYSDLSEKKDEYIAVSLANDNKTDKRASATVIALNAAVILALGKMGIFFARSGKPYKDRIANWLLNGVGSHIRFMNKHNIGRTPIEKTLLGCCTYMIGTAVSGAALGFVYDVYKTFKNTIVNGKISNTKSGVNGSWIQSGLRSLSSTEKGKEIIKNSIRKNDDGSVTVRFNGINREYTLTKQELKDASRSYVTYKNEDGDTVVGFKKKFSKGDGDVLAVEAAFEKYCIGVKSGLIAEDKNLPASMQTISDSGDFLYSSGSANQLYYLFTGKNSYKYDGRNENDIEGMYSKINLRNSIDKLKTNSDNIAAEIVLEDTGKKTLKIRDSLYFFHEIESGTKYSVISNDGKTVILANAAKQKDKIRVPLKNIEKYISEINYTELT